MLTKGAYGNLINRYKAVLKKCNLINTFGSLAVAGMLVMGSAGMASAAVLTSADLLGKVIDLKDASAEVNEKITLTELTHIIDINNSSTYTSSDPTLPYFHPNTITFNNGLEIDGTNGSGASRVGIDANYWNAHNQNANGGYYGGGVVLNSDEVTITNGGGINVGKLVIEKGTINVSGTYDNGDWQKGALLSGYGGIEVKDGTITLGDYGQMTTSAKIDNGTFKINGGKIILNGTDKDKGAMLAARGTNEININGGEIAVTGYGIFDTKTVNLNAGQVSVASGATLELLHKRATPEATNVFTVKGAVSNQGTIDAANSTINIAESGSYVSENGTLTGNLNIQSANASATFKGANTVSQLFDNLGTVNVETGSSLETTAFNNKGTLTLAGTLKGNVNLYNGSTLAFNVDQTGASQAGGYVQGAVSPSLSDGESATLKPIIATGVETGEYQYADSVTSLMSGDLLITPDNTLYEVVFKSDSELNILNFTKKEESAVADSVVAAGGTASNADALTAITSGSDSLSGETGTQIADNINTLAQSDLSQAIDAVTALAPEAAPVVQETEVQVASQVFSVVAGRMNGGAISSARNVSAGDYAVNQTTMWAQALYNASDYNTDGKRQDYDADSTGIALGIERNFTDSIKAGIGYAFTKTDIDGFLRETDVDTHTVLVYGEYKPNNWFVNGIASYGWSGYEEDKRVTGSLVTADYDVDVLGLQAMTGYDFHTNGFVITPEAGLRYLHISQDNYTDSVGQRISNDNMDMVTAIAGAKVSKDFALDNGMIIRPEARFGFTYDLTDEENNSVVRLANGSSYTVAGEALDRLGFEVGAGVTMELTDNLELALSYDGKFRQDYQDHTGLLNVMFKF